MDYNLFASSYRPQDGSNSTNLNAYGTAGINAEHGVYAVITN